MQSDESSRITESHATPALPFLKRVWQFSLLKVLLDAYIVILSIAIGAVILFSLAGAFSASGKAGEIIGYGLVIGIPAVLLFYVLSRFPIDILRLLTHTEAKLRKLGEHSSGRIRLPFLAFSWHANRVLALICLGAGLAAAPVIKYPAVGIILGLFLACTLWVWGDSSMVLVNIEKYSRPADVPLRRPGSPHFMALNAARYLLWACLLLVPISLMDTLSIGPVITIAVAILVVAFNLGVFTDIAAWAFYLNANTQHDSPASIQRFALNKFIALGLLVAIGLSGLAFMANLAVRVDYPSLLNPLYIMETGWDMFNLCAKPSVLKRHMLANLEAQPFQTLLQATLFTSLFFFATTFLLIIARQFQAIEQNVAKDKSTGLGPAFLGVKVVYFFLKIAAYFFPIIIAGLGVLALIGAGEAGVAFALTGCAFLLYIFLGALPDLLQCLLNIERSIRERGLPQRSKVNFTSLQNSEAQQDASCEP